MGGKIVQLRIPARSALLILGLGLFRSPPFIGYRR
jgi:hypothetical protein